MLMENGKSVSHEDFSLDQDPLEYTKIFRGYKAVNRFNTIIYICILSLELCLLHSPSSQL